MIKDESTQILENLITFLQTTIEQMVSSKMILQSSNQKISPEHLSRKLIQVLKNSLSSEREQYLQTLLQSLLKLTNDHNDLKDEYEKVCRTSRRESHKIRSENEEMERQYEKLQAQLHSYEGKKTNKDLNSNLQLQMKQDALENLHNVFDTAESTQYALKKQLSSIKIAVSKLQRGQIKMIQEAKTMCLEQMKESLQDMKFSIQNQQSDRIAQLTKSLKNATNENKQLHRTCNTMLQSIWALTPDGESHPEVTSKDFKNRIGEVCSFIDCFVEKERANQEKVLKSEVKKLVPGIQFTNYQSISETVDFYIQQQIKNKESEYKKILRRGEEEEKKLREKLESARIKIQKLQSASQSEGFSFDEQIDQGAADWEHQKEILDQTLIELEKERHSIISRDFPDSSDSNS